MIGDPTTIHLMISEKIDEELIKRGAVKTKGGSGPSGIDADKWLVSRPTKNIG